MLKFRMIAAALLLLGLLAPALGVAAEKSAVYPPLGLKELRSAVAGAKGKVVVVNAFASWCGPCREEMPGFIAVRQSFPEDKLLMLGVSLDEDMNALQQFAFKMKFNFPIYLGQRDFVQWAGISAIPHTLVYDKNGKLLVSEPGMVEEKELRAFLTKEIGKK